MSADALPITPATFARALEALPIPVIYAKVSELRNSIAHLRRSNQELAAYIAEGAKQHEDGTDGESSIGESDPELTTAISENEEVISRMEERVALAREEVERRGMHWVDIYEEKREEGEQQGGSGQTENENENATENDNTNEGQGVHL